MRLCCTERGPAQTLETADTAQKQTGEMTDLQWSGDHIIYRPEATVARQTARSRCLRLATLHYYSSFCVSFNVLLFRRYECHMLSEHEARCCRTVFSITAWCVCTSLIDIDCHQSSYDLMPCYLSWPASLEIKTLPCTKSTARRLLLALSHSVTVSAQSLPVDIVRVLLLLQSLR